MRSKAIYLALAVLPDGSHGIFGLWIAQIEGAKFLDESLQRSQGVRLVATSSSPTDGLKGMSEAPAAVFPETTLQICIVHRIRQSLDFRPLEE